MESLRHGLNDYPIFQVFFPVGQIGGGSYQNRLVITLKNRDFPFRSVWKWLRLIVEPMPIVIQGCWNND